MPDDLAPITVGSVRSGHAPCPSAGLWSRAVTSQAPPQPEATAAEKAVSLPPPIMGAGANRQSADQRLASQLRQVRRS